MPVLSELELRHIKETLLGVLAESEDLTNALVEDVESALASLGVTGEEMNNAYPDEE
jgi:hypothetical protein